MSLQKHFSINLKLTSCIISTILFISYNCLFTYPAGYAIVPVLQSTSNDELVDTVNPITLSSFIYK